MSGLQMLLKSFGIEIDPKEATQLFESLRVQVPGFIQTMATMLTDMDQRLKHIEDVLLEMQKAENDARRTERNLQREFDRINSGDNGSDRNNL